MRSMRPTSSQLSLLRRSVLVACTCVVSLGSANESAGQQMPPQKAPAKQRAESQVVRPPVLPPYQPPPQQIPWFVISQPWLWPLLAVAALAVKQKSEREEEEDMIVHQTEPSAAFEYKIIRSNIGAFKDPAKFRAVLEEEARAGWELFEKFDSTRARLKRPISCRQQDSELNQDPYRTHVSVGQGAIVLWIVLGTMVGVALVIGIILGVTAFVRKA